MGIQANKQTQGYLELGCASELRSRNRYFQREEVLELTLLRFLLPIFKHA